MQSAYETIILSPHLDDAALSCGGTIYQQTQANKPVLIVTFMAADPPTTPFSAFAQSLHDRWELSSEVVHTRRLEDIASAAVLGADYHHCDLLDAIYRSDEQTGGHFYTSDDALFGKLNETDAMQMLPHVTAVLQSLPPANQILCPLTVGSHVDHQLIRRAAEAFYGQSLVYYEDYPYARVPNSVENVIANDRLKLEHKVVPLNAEDCQQRAESVAAFASQISSFFNGRSDINMQIETYAKKVGGERFWYIPNQT